MRQTTSPKVPFDQPSIAFATGMSESAEVR